MSSENKVEGCFKRPLENEVCSSFTSPVVLHWGLACLGDIFGCLSSGRRCAASREGVGMLDSLQCTGCPHLRELARPPEEPYADGAWEELLAVCSQVGERRADRVAGQL